MEPVEPLSALPNSRCNSTKFDAYEAADRVPYLRHEARVRFPRRSHRLSFERSGPKSKGWHLCKASQYADSPKATLRFHSIILAFVTVLAYPIPITAELKTTVPPLAGEDISHPCEYQMDISSPGQPVNAVFVIFGRGPQSHVFYNDAEVRSFAAKHHLAMLLPLHCAAAHGEDMDVDREKGLGRALFIALDQLSTQSHHPELHTASVIVLGFSGAGALAARMPAFAPRRIAAAVVSHGGQSPPLGLNTIRLSHESLAIPQLVIVGGQDRIVGTALSYDYFRKHWLAGAPWLFATQNGAAHCCTVAAKPLILSWLHDVLTAHSQNVRASKWAAGGGYYAFFRKIPANLNDTGGEPVQQASDLFVGKVSTPRQGQSIAGWLPSRQTATLWQSFANLPPKQ